MMIPWLPKNPDAPFPPPEQAMTRPDGLLAAGGDLSASRLLAAYRSGIFPWYSPGQPILWWCPDPRCVLFTERVHVSRRLRRRMRSTPWTFTIDQAFDRVIAYCAVPRDADDGTWITGEMAKAYRGLHREGHAHSLEVWRESRLVGGIYGVALGRMFFGESMFHRESDASKAALVALSRQLAAWSFPLLDCQIHSGHVTRMGAVEIPREAFLDRARQLVAAPGPGRWAFELSADDLV